MAKLPHSLCALAIAVVGAFGGGASVHAQVPVAGLEEFFEKRGKAFAGLDSAIVSRQRAGSTRQQQKALSAMGGRRFSIGARHEVLRFARGSRSWRQAAAAGLSWTAPKHTLLDRVSEHVSLPRARAQGGGTGQGVVIGIVDTGVDVTHPSLRNAQGRTRVAYHLDLLRPPLGLQAALEQEWGCQDRPGLRCRILASEDIDDLLFNGIEGDEPFDRIGHGTHVASIAAGRSFNSEDDYVGVAPEATLITAQVAGVQGDIRDADVLLAVEFVFERARELGLPAVVNLSLGGDFGPHDGSSPLAEALASLVGEEQPGRAIVVAGGNSGQLINAPGIPQLEPLGAHNEFEINGRTSVPVLVPSRVGVSEHTGSLFLWLNLYTDSELRVGLRGPDNLEVELQPPGAATSAFSEGAAVAVITGRAELAQEGDIEPFIELLLNDSVGDFPPGAAAILIDGTWSAGRGFEVLLEGNGRAEMWLQGEGLSQSALGAYLPRAQSAQTVAIPAAHADLIAVGASVNRLSWPGAEGKDVSTEVLYRGRSLKPGELAGFSSRGPNALGQIKPDIVAPGALVVGALSREAEPAENPFSIFGSGSPCSQGVGCLVSELHAVAQGSSMASPAVSGAVALLFEQEPSLTQPQILARLQAGSRTLPSSTQVGEGGGGLLDIEAITAQGVEAPAQWSPGSSLTVRWEFASGFAVPDPKREVSALIWLRDEQDKSASVPFPDLFLQVEGADIRTPLHEVAPGLLAFSVAPQQANVLGSMHLELLVDDRSLASVALPIDYQLPAPPESKHGGCGVVPSRSFPLEGGYGWLLGLALLWGRRRFSPREAVSTSAR